jgi:Ca2+-binding EF-hand superfamily protein
MTQSFPALAIGVLAATSLLAQEPQRPGGPGGPGGRGGPGGPGFAIFAALDADHDNALSAPEIGNAAAVLKALDRNGDGRVTADEFPAGRGGPGGPGRGRGGSGIGGEAPATPTSPEELAATLMAFDRNNDGRLKKDEVPERLQGIFARADDNKDGELTPDEIKKAAAAQPQPTAGGRGERGREGEGRGGEGRGGPPRRDVLFAALDQDGDGALSAEEIAAATAALKKLDVNGDGSLALEELFAGGRGRG